MLYVVNRFPYNARYGARGRMRNMLRKHGKFCRYCDVEMTKDIRDRAPSRDHIIPLSRGGPDTFENIAMACRACNEEKGSLTAEEYVAWKAGLASRLDFPAGHKRRWLALKEPL